VHDHDAGSFFTGAVNAVVLTAFCMSATPFAADGSVDGPALRQHLRRLVAEGVGVYLGSGGAGEGHALSLDELALVYEIGVAECKGRVPVYANPPEPRTASAIAGPIALAVQAGVDVVQVYAPDPGHGMRPTEAELEAYYVDVLSGYSHPTALSVHSVLGYVATANLIARVCERFEQVVAINLIGVSGQYVVDLRDRLRPDIRLYVPLTALPEGLLLGADGFLGAEANVLPTTCKALIDAFTRSDHRAARAPYRDLVRFSQVVGRWAPSTARWVKMALRVLGLPGGAGGLRKPYLMPGDDDLGAMRDALGRLGIAELDARIAGAP
jgi:4-hydroxy-tetrahydrodipicolinate synthase